MADKPVMKTHHTTTTTTVTHHHKHNDENLAWARRQIAKRRTSHYGHLVKHATEGTAQKGYKWVEKSYWSKQRAIVERAHHTYQSCKVNFHNNHKGPGATAAWKKSPERRKAHMALELELHRAQDIIKSGKGNVKAARALAAKIKARMQYNAHHLLTKARGRISTINKKTGKALLSIMDVAQKAKYRAIRKAKLRKERADRHLKASIKKADAAIGTAAWKAKQARIEATKEKDAMKAKEARVHAKAKKVKAAMMAKARAKRAAVAAHAKLVQQRALKKEKKVREARVERERSKIAHKEHEATEQRRVDAREYRSEQHKMRHDKRRMERDERKEHRLAPQQEHCEQHMTVQRHHYHGATEDAYVKKDYWVKEPSTVEHVHTVEKHIHLAKYHGHSETKSHLEVLQEAAVKAAKIYRGQVDIVNTQNEKRYEIYIRKVAHSRKASMKKREARLVIVDKKIAEFKAKLEDGFQGKLKVRREVEAKKLAAIRAEYFKQLKAAEAEYNKSRVIDNFDKKLDQYRSKIMAASDVGPVFRAKLQKEILAKLVKYRKSLKMLEDAKLEHYKKSMTTTSEELNKYTSLYAAGQDVSKSRKAYWVKYAKDLGLDNVTYEDTVEHHHHHGSHTKVVHHTHRHTIVIQEGGPRVADHVETKNLQVVTASHTDEDRPSFGDESDSEHEEHHTRTVVTHTTTESHSTQVSAIAHAKSLVKAAKVAIKQAKKGKVSKESAQAAVKAAKDAVADAHKKMTKSGTHKQAGPKSKALVQVASSAYLKAIAKLNSMEKSEA